MLSAISLPSKAGDFAEEAVVDEPEAADHGEAERVGEQVFALVPERVRDFPVPTFLAMPRFSTSSVIAIAKTPSLKATIRENSISFPSRCFAVRSLATRGSSHAGRDGTAEPIPPRMAAARRRSSVGRALHS